MSVKKAIIPAAGLGTNYTLQQAMYSYIFKGKRYDVGNKLGSLQPTVEFVLGRDDLKDEFRSYLMELLKEDMDTDRFVADDVKSDEEDDSVPYL